MSTEEGCWLEGLDERTENDRMTAEHSSEEGGEGLTTCPGRIPVEHTIGCLPDDCAVCAPANARLQAVLADRLAAVQAEWKAATGEIDPEHARLSMDDLAATCDDLRGRLAAVEELADEWEARGEYGDASLTQFARLLRAALANPSAAQGEGEVTTP